MEIEVRLFGFETSIQHPIRLQWDDAPRLAEALAMLPISQDVETIVLVNGRTATPDLRLADGDKIAVFPPMTGG
uniref:MoaD/ThiS family protein n=1 Tax=Desulfatirhabdium butyrativorans TaxID=340467 RepID=A0A7C4RQP5_9BACT